MNAYTAPTAPAQRRRVASLILAAAVAGAFVAGCGGGGGGSSSASTDTTTTTTTTTSGPLANNQLTGAIDYIHDPAVLRQGSTWHVFSTDASATQGGFIPERCTTDKIAVTDCGYVFSTLPSWIASAVPLATEIWAPDISYFNGLYHLYYSASSFGSNVSAIGMATKHHAGSQRRGPTPGSTRAWCCNPPAPTTSTRSIRTWSSTPRTACGSTTAASGPASTSWSSIRAPARSSPAPRARTWRSA